MFSDDFSNLFQRTVNKSPIHVEKADTQNELEVHDIERKLPAIWSSVTEYQFTGWI